MGVKNFFKVIKDTVPEAIQSVDLKQISGSWIGIDMSLTIYQVVLGIAVNTNITNKNNEEITHLYGLLKRLTIFKKLNVNLIAVFDGKACDLKTITLQNRKKQQEKNIIKDDSFKNRFTLTDKIINEVKEMLSVLGIPYMTAKSEADILLAKLYHDNKIQFILSDDSDIPIFGGHKLIRKLKSTSKTIEIVDISIVLEKLRWDQNKLIELACLLGNDYNKNPKSIGWKGSIKGLTEHKNMKEFLISKKKGEDLPVLMETFDYFKNAGKVETYDSTFIFGTEKIEIIEKYFIEKLSLNESNFKSLYNVWKKQIVFEVHKNKISLSNDCIEYLDQIFSKKKKGNYNDYMWLKNLHPYTLNLKIKDNLEELLNNKYFSNCVI